MSRTTETTTVIRCDLCGLECNPVKEIRGTIQYTPVQAAGVAFKPIPFGVNSPNTSDVCKTCVAKAMRKWLEENP